MTAELPYRSLCWLLGVTLTIVALVGVWHPAGLHWDFANFYDAGHRVLAGEADHLYHERRPIEGLPPQGVMRHWGPPIAALIYVPLALVPPEIALRLFKIENVLAWLAGVVLLLRFYRPVRDWRASSDRPRHIAAVLLLVLLFQPFWSVLVVGGQTTPTVFLLLVLFLKGFVRGAPWTAALLLSVVLLIKPALVVVVVVFLMAGQLRFVTALGVCLATAGLLSLSLFGWPVHREFLARAAGGVGADRLWKFNSSLPTLILNFQLLWPDAAVPDAAREVFKALVLLVRAGVAALFVTLVLRASRMPLSAEGRRNYTALMALLFFLLFSDVIWEHYVAVLLLPAAFILTRPDSFSRGAVRLILASLVLSVGQNVALTLTLDRLFRFDNVPALLWIGLVKSGPLLLAVMFLLRYHDEFARANRDLRPTLPAEGGTP